MTSSQQQGIVLQEAYFADRQVTTNDNVGYFVLPKGYFTYRSRSDTDVFVFNRNDILDKGIISYYYPVFQTKYTCSDFLLRRLNHGIRKQLAMAAEGTGQKVLAHSKFKNMTVSVPKIGEQQKIGTFFRQLDRLITLHQRKRGRLENIKKAMLEKMFPKNGADVPEVRFAGFTEAWEQRKLGEVAKLNNGKDYKHLGDGNIPVYGTGGYMLSVNQALSYKDDAIGIGRKGTIDKPYILKAPFWTVDTLFYSIPNDKTELNFLFATFQKVDWKAADESTGVPSLSKSTIENIITFFPSLPEQARIGAFFCHLDRLITLHQRKVALLQNIKKACLEKMFV